MRLKLLALLTALALALSLAACSPKGGDNTSPEGDKPGTGSVDLPLDEF